jgi:hypothetical protein
MASRVACGVGVDPVTVSPATVAVVGDGRRVFSGIVLTVPEATRSVTYIVSGRPGP